MKTHLLLSLAVLAVVIASLGACIDLEPYPRVEVPADVGSCDEDAGTEVDAACDGGAEQ